MKYPICQLLAGASRARRAARLSPPWRRSTMMTESVQTSKLCAVLASEIGQNQRTAGSFFAPALAKNRQCEVKDVHTEGVRP